MDIRHVSLSARLLGPRLHCTHRIREDRQVLCRIGETFEIVIANSSSCSPNWLTLSERCIRILFEEYALSTTTASGSE